MAKLDYLTAGIESLESALEDLAQGTDRRLRAAILLGFHSVTSLLKAAAVSQGISVMKGAHSLDFPGLVGALKAKGWLSKENSKALHVLADVRNPLEHEEVDYERKEFEAALHGVFPILERIVRERAGLDLQETLSPEAWETLVSINKFFEHRYEQLEAIVEGVLAREVGVGENRSISGAEAGFCDECGNQGLPWQGGHREEVRCRLCGEINIVTACNWCSGPVPITEDDEWPYYHDECMASYLSSE